MPLNSIVVRVGGDAGDRVELFVKAPEFSAGLILVLRIVALGEQVARLHHVENSLSPVLGVLVEDPQIEMRFRRPGAQLQGFMKRFDGPRELPPPIVFRRQLEPPSRIVRFALYAGLVFLDLVRSK